MKLAVLCFLICTLSLSLSAQTEGVCFSSIEEYQNIKVSLPEIFQKIPAYFTNSVFGLGGGAFKLTPVSSVGKFKIDGGYFKFSEKKLFDSSYLKKFCLKNEVITVTLENGKEYKITEIENKTFILHFINKEGSRDQASLYLSSQQDYNKIINKVAPGMNTHQEEGTK